MANVIDPVRRHADTHPDTVAVRGESTPGELTALTYVELLSRGVRYAAALTESGLRVGDRVLLIAPTVPEFIVAYMGIQVAGAIVVPVNTISTQLEVEYVLKDAGCALLIAWHALGPAAPSAARVQGIPMRTLHPGAGSSLSVTMDVHERDLIDTAAILYTSGTTGRPKGAELTVSNLLSAGRIGVQCSQSTRADRTGTALPLFHVFGQASVMMTTLTAGGSLSLLARFDPQAMTAMVRRDRLTVLVGVPTMWSAMVHTPDSNDSTDFSQLRIAVSGGASLPAAVTTEFESRFGCTILEGYGLTETTAFATFSDPDRSGKIGCVGRATPSTHIEIRDEAGRDCPTAAIGEIFVRGATVMKGYWNRPLDTTEVLDDDGWFRTGDLGTVDSNGDLRIVGRLKDLIIRGGYNVYPSEVEAALYSHPDILEVAVIGIPDDYYGQNVAAVVVQRPRSTLDADDVTAWARQRVSAYKVPRIVCFVDALPKGATGKILKRAIDHDPVIRAARLSQS